LQDPAAHRLVGVGALSAILILAIEVAITGLLSVFALKATRHFVDVARVHREAPRIDLFDPAPLYAFSRLTSQTALGILLLLAVLIPSLAPTYFTADAATVSTRLSFISLVIGAVASATTMFVLPLYGMHRRIALEKEHLQTASGARLTAVLAELDHDVRKIDLARADALNKLLASVLAERDVLARLPTWPWQAATLRGFVSALILPVLVYVLARAAGARRPVAREPPADRLCYGVLRGRNGSQTEPCRGARVEAEPVCLPRSREGWRNPRGDRARPPGRAPWSEPAIEALNPRSDDRGWAGDPGNVRPSEDPSASQDPGAAAIGDRPRDA
jgi:hypothetical protein